jgi:hypothetical protein
MRQPDLACINNGKAGNMNMKPIVLIVDDEKVIRHTLDALLN